MGRDIKNAIETVVVVLALFIIIGGIATGFALWEAHLIESEQKLYACLLGVGFLLFAFSCIVIGGGIYIHYYGVDIPGPLNGVIEYKKGEYRVVKHDKDEKLDGAITILDK